MEPQKLQQLKKEFGDKKRYLETDEVAKAMNKRYEVHWDRGRAYTRLTHLRDFFEIGEKANYTEERGSEKWKIKFSDLAYFARVIQHENEVKIKEACKRVWKEEKALQKKSTEEKSKSTVSKHNQDKKKACSVASFRAEETFHSKMERFIKEQGLRNKSELIRKSIENYMKSSEEKKKEKESLYQRIKSLLPPKSSDIGKEESEKREKSLQESSSALTKIGEDGNRISRERTKMLKEDKTLEKKAIIEIDEIREKFDLQLDKEKILTAFTDPSIGQNYDWMTDNKVYAEFGEETLRETLEIFFFQQDHEAKQIKVHLENWGEDKLGQIGRKIGLHNHVLVGENQMAEANSVLSQVIKAIIGVIKFHQSLAEAQKWIENFLLAEVSKND